MNDKEMIKLLIQTLKQMVSHFRNPPGKLEHQDHLNQYMMQEEKILRNAESILKLADENQDQGGKQ